MVFFHPPKSPIPFGFTTKSFVIRPLQVEDAKMHYDAVIASKQSLRKWSGTGWPPDDFKLEDDIIEIEQYHKYHTQQAAFSFAVLTTDESTLLGCVHINSLVSELFIGEKDTEDLTTVTRYEGVVVFWVREKLIAQEFDRQLLRTIVNWMDNDWSFTRVLFRINTNDLRQMQLLSELGRRHLYVLDPPDREGKHILHG